MALSVQIKHNEECVIVGKIVAIGGGELRDLETLSIDKEIVKWTGKNNPKALFIPTASNDAEGYWETFQEVYGHKLNCRTDVLCLVRDNLSEKEIAQKILEADLIYVGGGNTQKMIHIWKENKVDKLLEEAFNRGIVLSGLSAGSICWFKYGHSDALSFSEDHDWKYIKVDGLGFLDAFHCPHYNEDNREQNFPKMIEKFGEIGIAIENNCAIEFIEEKYRVISSEKNAKAYKIYRQNDNVEVKEIVKDAHFRNINELFS